MVKDNDDDDVVDKKKILYDKTTEIEIPYETYLQICKYIELKYDTEELSVKQKKEEIEIIIKAGLAILLQKFSTSSSTSFILNGKKLRKDEALNIAKIMVWLKRQSSFPEFSKKQIEMFIKRIVYHGDSRGPVKYMQTISNEIVKNYTNGTYHVMSLYDQIPKSLLIKAEKEIDDGIS
jgi:hypothetical protein